MNEVEKVKKICKERKMPISKLSDTAANTKFYYVVTTQTEQQKMGRE